MPNFLFIAWQVVLVLSFAMWVYIFSVTRKIQKKSKKKKKKK
jgi:hypothetical protein